MKMKSFMLIFLTGLVFLFSCGSLVDSEVEKVSVERANELLDNNSEIKVIDVRTRDEFREGQIPGAKNLDVTADDFEEQADLLSKSQEIMVVCAAGTRSAKAVEILKKKGFKKIYEIEGGMDEWKAKRMKVSITF